MGECNECTANGVQQTVFNQNPNRITKDYITKVGGAREETKAGGARWGLTARTKAHRRVEGMRSHGGDSAGETRG